MPGDTVDSTMTSTPSFMTFARSRQACLAGRRSFWARRSGSTGVSTPIVDDVGLGEGRVDSVVATSFFSATTRRKSLGQLGLTVALDGAISGVDARHPIGLHVDADDHGSPAAATPAATATPTYPRPTDAQPWPRVMDAAAQLLHEGAWKGRRGPRKDEGQAAPWLTRGNAVLQELSVSSPRGR